MTTLDDWAQRNPEIADEIAAYARLAQLRQRGYFTGTIQFPFFNHHHQHHHVSATVYENREVQYEAWGVTLREAVDIMLAQMPADLVAGLDGPVLDAQPFPTFNVRNTGSEQYAADDHPPMFPPERS